MGHHARMVLLAGLMLCAGCATTAPASGPPPRACGLAEFGDAPGIMLPNPPPKKSAGKSAPAQGAAPLDVGKTTATAGKWYDPTPGWKAWRLWLRSDAARTMAVKLSPFDLPYGAQMWICSPDGTLRQGPLGGRGPSGDGEVYSGIAGGPEIWLELIVPAAEQGAVKLGVPQAFGGQR